MPCVVRGDEGGLMTGRWVTGVVLGAGGSRRLGRPKQLRPYADTTVLGATVDVARGCGFDQLIVTLGGAADAVREAVLLDDVDVVTVDDFGSGCSSSADMTTARVILSGWAEACFANSHRYTETRACGSSSSPADSRCGSFRSTDTCRWTSTAGMTTGDSSRRCRDECLRGRRRGR